MLTTTTTTGRSTTSMMKGGRTKRPELTADQQEELTSSFQLFDSEGRGAIDLHELKVLMRALGFPVSKQDVLAMVREVNPQNQGLVSYEEYLEIMADRFAARNPEEEIRKAFALFAGDKGLISLADLKRVAKQLGERLSEDELGAMVAEFDRDGDGCINEEEFAMIMKGSGSF